MRRKVEAEALPPKWLRMRLRRFWLRGWPSPLRGSPGLPTAPAIVATRPTSRESALSVIGRAQWSVSTGESHSGASSNGYVALSFLTNRKPSTLKVKTSFGRT